MTGPTGWHRHGARGPVHPEPTSALTYHKPRPDGRLSACYAADSDCVPVHIFTDPELLARDERIRADEREKLAAELAVVDPRDGEVCCSGGCVEGTPGEGACELAQPLAGEVEAQ